MTALRSVAFFSTSGVRGASLREALQKQGAKFIEHCLMRFENGNVAVSIAEPIAERCVMIWSPGESIGDSLVELALMCDAARRAGASEVTCVLPYLDYSRSDKTEGCGTALGARVFVDLLCACEIDRFVVSDLHVPAVIGFFRKPVVQLDAIEALIAALPMNQYDVVLAPDGGRYREAQRVARALGIPADFLLKERDQRSDRVTLAPVFSSIARFGGKRVLVFDDETVSGRTLGNCVRALVGAGASAVDASALYIFSSRDILDGESLCGLRTLFGTNLGGPEFGCSAREVLVDVVGDLLACLNRRL